MKCHFTKVIAGTAVLTLMVVAVAPSVAMEAAPQAIGSPIQDREITLEYWTDDLMQQAEISQGMEQSPAEEVITENGDLLGYAPMPAPYISNQLSRVNGALFYREPDGFHVHCSASVINSESKSLIVTAAHCVMGTDNKWKELMMFVPAYNGAAKEGERIPLGKWAVKQAFVPSSVPSGQSIDNDIAVARLHLLPPTLPIGPEESVEQKVRGGLKPRVNESELFNIIKIAGYPGAERYSGMQQQCDSYTAVVEGTTGLFATNCGTMSGNSGGPLVLPSSEESSASEVVAVVHNNVSHARLRESTFGVIYRAADANNQ